MTTSDVAYRDAAIRLAGLRPVVVPERSGLALDKEAAATAIVSTLASLDRTPVKLSTGTAEPKVTAEMLAPVADKVRTAVSRPVKLVSGNGFTLVPRRRIAKLLDLPSGGERALRIGGPAADAYFAQLAKTINTQPQNADFVIADSGRVVIKPSVNARAVDVPRTAKGLFAGRAASRTPLGADRRRHEGACPHDRRGEEDGHHRASSAATRRSTAATRTACTTSSSWPTSSTTR